MMEGNQIVVTKHYVIVNAEHQFIIKKLVDICFQPKIS